MTALEKINRSIPWRKKRIVKKQRKPIDLIKRDFISLNIDLKQMGVGGDNNSWGARTLNKYILELVIMNFPSQLTH